MKSSFSLVVALLFIAITQAQVNPPGVTIGTQTWMLKNLNVSTYRNGDPIPEVQDSAAWSKLTTGAWCYFKNDPENGKTYGKLYNWYAVNDPRGLAPAGWHIPSEKEWTELSDFLGGDAVSGGKMKETGTIYWIEPNTDATNTSGFTGLPGGLRFDDGGFFLRRALGNWWSSTEFNNTKSWYCLLSRGNGRLKKVEIEKPYGFSVRCIRD